jgi:hypothetical protein
VLLAWVGLGALAPSAAAQAPPARIPILHSTDLFHPHEDPDDHYDLACLFALPEFDIRGVILDMGAEQAKRCGRPAVDQMMKITGRRAPVAIGLGRRLRDRADKALDEPEEFQGAVRLILATLRESREKVTIFTTGSCRDVAAAFNREPALLKEKVRAIYFNIGNGPNEKQDEFNVAYDPAAYLRLFESGLPLYWCPCFGKDGYETHYRADQAGTIGACTEPVRNFFAYALTKSKEEPIAFLASGPHDLPKGPKDMWCTAPMLHAAGRKVYERGPDDFVALPPAEAEKAGLAAKGVPCFDFVPMRATLAEATPAAPAALRVDLKPAEPDGCVFRQTDPRYKKAMASCLKNLLADLGR